MPIKAQVIDDWYCDDLDAQDEIDKVVDGESSHMEKTDHYTITLSRKFCNLIMHFPDNGLEKSAFVFKTGANATVQWSYPGKKFRCTQDRIQITDPITGEGLQTQTWEHYADPVAMAGTAYPP